MIDVAYRRALRPVLFRAYGGDPERIHERTLAMITEIGEVRPARAAATAFCARHRVPVEMAGIRFPGLVGLAAGMDKNGYAIRSWAALGFGHAELGTVTAHAQPGNDRPRLFRLPASHALINRMGFNNAGAAALADRLATAGVLRGNQAMGIPLGISIGKSKITPLAEVAEDYLTSLRLLIPYADYLAINVSSPNTPGLRTLQDASTLRELIKALVGEAWRTAAGRSPGLPAGGGTRRSGPTRRLAPDLTEDALEEILAVCIEEGVEGLIATNTTLARDGVHPADAATAAETGGLSGAPLTRRARQVVGILTARTQLPDIAVGGILTRDDGQAMLDAGARLLQVYTGYVYRGPALVSALNRLQPPAGIS